MKYILVVCALLAFSVQVNGAKILGVFPFPGPSQYIYGSALLKALAERGHEVTSINVFPQKKPLKNFRDIFIKESVGLYGSMMNSTLNEEEFSFFDTSVYDLVKILSVNLLENGEVKELLKNPNEKFDLVIMETFVNEVLCGFGPHFHAPLVGISTMGTMKPIDILVGNPSPVSYIPHMMMASQAHMTFTERLLNLLVNAYEHVNCHFVQLPRQEELYRKYFPHVEMDFYETVKNFSLVLLNDHFSLNAPRPYVPNMVEVVGLHIKQDPDPLPKDLQVLLDNATEGAIYFSLGSNIKSKDLPAAKRDVFMNVFRTLKQKVLWKFEDPDLPGKPDNVYISKWYPQPSVLAHPNVKVFISHGGLLSTIESTFHGTPVLGMPFFGDQKMNVKNSVRRGFALAMGFKNLNEQELKDKLNELLYNRKYANKAKEMSILIRDQPLTPMERAIYWVEYVLRHKGAHHLRNAGQDLNFFQYHSLDTIFTLLLGLVLALAIVVWVAAKVLGVLIKPKKSKAKTN